MEKFLFILFWALVIYYMFRLFFKYVVPWLIARYVKNMQQKMGNQFDRKTNRQPDYHTTQPDNGVHVDYIPKEKPKIDSGVGEYVDFEDINGTNPKL